MRLKFFMLGIVGTLLLSKAYSQEINPIKNKQDSILIEKEDSLDLGNKTTNNLQEVVVIGYGAVKKQNLTSAVGQVKAESFDERPIYNIEQGLQGNVAGVNVVQPSGKPGSGLEVKIRGINSINSSTKPLYVIDGIQTYDISGVNPDDVIDMVVLKDASSTAIYGVNGSSGVIIVTTKKAKSNQTTFGFNVYTGFSKVANNIDVLNLDQYKSLISDINPGFLATANSDRYAGINTNWRDQVFRTGVDQNYNVNYGFGGEGFRIYSSFGYQGIEGIINPARNNRFSSRINFDADITKWLKVNGSFSYIRTNLYNSNDNMSVSRGGVVMATLNTPAFLPVYADQLKIREVDSTTGEFLDGYKDGQFALNPYQSSWENPVAYQSRKNESVTDRFLSSINFEVSLAKGLKWKPAVTLDYLNLENETFTDAFRTSYGRQERGVGSLDNSLYQNYNIENTLNYTLKKNVHDFNLIVGNSFQENKYKRHGYWGKGFPTTLMSFDYDKAEPANRTQSRDASITRYVSFFGQANYTFNDKYSVMAVLRASGASSLAPGNKWGYFPGLSAAWIISNEDFLKGNSTISQLKVRAGWGITGNVSGIPAYSHWALRKEANIGSEQLNPTQTENSDLTWETTEDKNIGFDFGFLRNRIRVSADFYHRNTTDLLMNLSFPGIPVSYQYNGGEMTNKGMEFTLSTQNINNETFKWNSSFNISFNKNKVKSIDYMEIRDMAYFETVGANAVRLMPGHVVGAFYGYVVDRVDANTGELLYKDLDGNGSFNSGDRTFIGDPNPDFTFGFTNNFKYKNFYLDFLITGSVGNDIFNASRLDLELMNDFKNQSTAVLNRWTTPGQITNIPKAGSSSALFLSDRFIEDGSYVRLKAVTLGYNFKKALGFNSINFYVTGQNLLTITDYSGFDPEVNSNGGSVMGIDYGAYPQVRTFVVGIKASL
ncbi:TonB-linked outer membrane protein, SusC/RagA family [Chishuiella changwenlii]|uniref:TonB-linked outer membrane protein, SusC/RagA family n=2 Tax=Chishuiella changwenlii TaxID=1434701 RepID=A0A1M6ZVC1_9FLAO|nr:SusC/RagA family TonB-linked outer membrane protein [Chishuiella changwenlii]SHL34364.1 TonB-linked outer membrane protein, SusC/RagA family [Chishuiella changwenlii]